MQTPQTTLGIRRRSFDSDTCDIFIVGEASGATVTPCSVSWSTLKEKLRDAWSLEDMELDKIQEELFSTGKLYSSPQAGLQRKSGH